MPADHDAIVVGAGFYGLSIALHLRRTVGFSSVLVYEQEPELMDRSSYANQARVHGGYHYPRSILTAYRSRLNFPRFANEFGEAIDDRFDHYYAIPRRLSKVNSRQFELFCTRIGAPVEAAPEIMGLLSPINIEAAFRVVEPAFNSRVLREILVDQVDRAGGIEIRTSSAVDTIAAAGPNIEVHTQDQTRTAVHVINATYSQINELHRRSGLPTIELQHEIAELALVEVPAAWRNSALTVMDGPFFSMMPFPDRGLHSLSHVRYTPHHRWKDKAGSPTLNPAEVMASIQEQSRFSAMKADASRYAPSLSSLQHRDSLWEIKTVLSKSDNDDSRPILFRPHHGIQNYTCIMGGKLDNIYDVLQELTLLYG